MYLLAISLRISIFFFFFAKDSKFMSFAYKVRRLESQGVSSKDAEALTTSLKDVLNDYLELVDNSYVSINESEIVSLGFLLEAQRFMYIRSCWKLLY